MSAGSILLQLTEMLERDRYTDFCLRKVKNDWIFCSISDTSVIPQQHAVLQSMNIQREDTSRSDPVFRDDGQNLEISVRIRIISNS